MHFQNGVAEKWIRDLQDSSRYMFLHAMARWPQAISIHLWPYAFLTANDNRNVSTSMKSRISPIEKFSQVEITPTLRHSHVFGCPVYPLTQQLQSGHSIPKWSPRARLGINLGKSPHHARSVALVLNVSTGLVSPQFHVQHDDFFETVHYQSPKEALNINWMHLAGFKSNTNNKNDKYNKVEFDHSPIHLLHYKESTPEIPTLQDDIQDNMEQYAHESPRRSPRIA